MGWTIGVAAGLTLALLAVGGLMTQVGAWYAALRKPSWNPPNWLFGPAWTVILGLAAWAGVLAWSHAPDDAARWRIGLLYGVNMVFHALWSPLFFTLKRPDWRWSRPRCCGCRCWRWWSDWRPTRAWPLGCSRRTSSGWRSRRC